MVDMNNKRFVFIFMHLAEGDSLSVFLRKKEKNGQSLAEETCKRMSAQIISAVNQLHIKGIAHRHVFCNKKCFC